MGAEFALFLGVGKNLVMASDEGITLGFSPLLRFLEGSGGPEAANTDAANSDEARKNKTWTVGERVGIMFSNLLCGATCSAGN